jgi:hypothetical protein
MKYGLGCGWVFLASAGAEEPSDAMARVSSACITSSRTESGLVEEADAGPPGLRGAANARLPPIKNVVSESPVNQRFVKADSACSLQFALPESLPDAPRYWLDEWFCGRVILAR